MLKIAKFKKDSNLLELPRGQAQFKMEITQVAQLKSWLEKNSNAIGPAFLGRSNVGKSTLINALFGKATARTSKTPGRTRGVMVFEFKLGDIEEPFYFFDLPGYGHADVSKEMLKNWQELMTLLFSSGPKGMLVVNVQDARHPNQRADLLFQDFLNQYNLNTFLIFNKTDKLKKQKEKAALKKLKLKLYEQYTWVEQIFFTSAEKKDGIKPLEDSLINYLLKKYDAFKASEED